MIRNQRNPKIQGRKSDDKNNRPLEDLLVIEYRTTSSRKRKNEIIKHLLGYYEYRVSKVIASYPNIPEEEIRSIYTLLVLNCINNWKPGLARFTSYIYIYSGQKLVTEIHRKIKQVENRYVPFGYEQLEYFEGVVQYDEY